MQPAPIAFMSYVRLDDQHDNGRMTQLRERLSGEVRLQTGEEFPIFQDRNDIKWGQQWKQRIDDSIDQATFLIPLITPAFFRSPPCRGELEQFLQRERKLLRSDLILPIYYFECEILGNSEMRAQDELASAIAARQYVDWRELRFEPLTSPHVGRMLAGMAGQIVAALKNGRQSAPQTPRTLEDIVETESNERVEIARDVTITTKTESDQGPSRKTQPPTLVVDALHRGDHLTLTAALDAARPGDRILVRPGLYRESVVIEKPVEIIGDGVCSEIVIEASDKVTILFRADMGRIVNLTLRKGSDNAGYCVDIAQGRLDLEDCDITSQSLSCISIHDGADPRIRRNRIHSGREAGVNVYDNGQGTLEDNEIFANALAGVTIKLGGNPILRRNRIHDGTQNGVLVSNNGLGTLEDNEIFANRLAGVAIKSGGNPVLRRNRIHDGAQGGVFVNTDGLGILEDNEISKNALANVEIKSGGNPILRRNRIHSGLQGGVLIHENGKGLLEDNEIYTNQLSAAEIRHGANTTLRRNRIHGGKDSGVYIHDKGKALLEANEIIGNADSGVEIQADGIFTLKKNRISENLIGIRVCNGGGSGTAEQNDLRGNSRGAWEIGKDLEGNIKRTRNQE